MIGFADFSQFLQGLDTPIRLNGFVTTTFLRATPTATIAANETGEYLQDKFQIRPNLSVTLGLRFDYHGGLTEKNGELYNFDPALYNYDAATDTIISNGFIIAGNNPLFPTERCQQFHSHRPAMGPRSAHRRRLEPEDVQ